MPGTGFADGIDVVSCCGCHPVAHSNGFICSERCVLEKLDAALREEGLVVGGNYGCLAGKVFRIGHMGAQADMQLVKEAMDVLEKTVLDF